MWLASPFEMNMLTNKANTVNMLANEYIFYSLLGVQLSQLVVSQLCLNRFLLTIVRL